MTGRIIAAHDIYGSTGTKYGYGYVYTSDDLGLTFTKTFEQPQVLWPTIFEQGSYIFMIYTTGFNTSYSDGSIALRYSSDDGDTWSAQQILFADDGTFKGYQTHASSVIIKNGYVAIAVVKNTTTAIFASSFTVGIMYGNITDLTNIANWSLSAFVAFDINSYPVTIGSSANGTSQPKGTTSSKGHLEPCLVDSGVNMYLHCRVEQSPNSNYGVYYDVTWDSGTPPNSTVSSTPNYHEFPGGNLKTQITWDSTSGKYWTISNWNRFKYMSDNRSELYLSYSSNLIDWTVCQKVGGREITSLWETEIANIGTCYASFIIDGNDIYFTARTGTSSASNYHDSDILSISKIENFRSQTEQIFINGSLIIDENSQRLENVDGIGIILDQSKYQNSPFMLTANNASKVDWVSGLNFTGGKYMRVAHNEFLNPDNGFSVFAVIENLQSTGGGRILSKSDAYDDVDPNNISFSPEGLSIGECWTSYNDLVVSNNYILASSYDDINNDIYNFSNGVNRGAPASVANGTWNTSKIEKTAAYTKGNIAELWIGGRQSPSLLSFTSKIKALHIFPNYMTPAEILSYTNDLNAIYSIY